MSPSGHAGPVRRTEDPRLITGAGQYVDDLRLAEADCLHVAFVRSPYPHARIVSVDTAAARALPGMRAILMGADVAHLVRVPASRWVPGLLLPARAPLATDLVRCVGTPVAAVVAASRALAEDAARAVEVEYDVLDAVADSLAALAEDAPLVHPDVGTNVAFRHRLGDGDVAGAFDGAAHVVAIRSCTPRVAPMALEPRAGLASPAGDRLTIWSSNQSVYRLRDNLAQVMGLPVEHVRALALDVGGAFGSKTGLFDEDIVLAFVAMQLDRPARWLATRSEDLLTTHHGRAQIVDLEGAFDGRGRLLAVRGRVLCDLGALPLDSATISPARTGVMLTGPYRIGAAEIELVGVFTNLPATGAYRGAGRPEATLALERLMDVAAARLGIERADLRRRNFIGPQEFPWRTATGKTYDSGDYAAAFDRALELANYPAVREATPRRPGELVGVGLSAFVEPSGGGGESAEVRLLPGGGFEARLGSTAHGQGHETTFSRLVGHALGVAPEQVTVRQGDSDLLPTGVGTFASRTAQVAGSSLRQACDRLLGQARERAATLLEAGKGDVALEEGSFRVVGAPQRAVSWADLARDASARGAELSARETFVEPDETYSFGTFVAVVRVDQDTGVAAVERIVGVDDSGTVLEPALVAGQVHGALAQGLGQALLEGMLADESGQIVTGSLLDYAVPRASSMPELVLDHTVTPSPLNPLGAKGAGEGGSVGVPPAIVGGVLDALRARGVEHLDPPLTAERVWRALQQQGITPDRVSNGGQREGGASGPWAQTG